MTVQLYGVLPVAAGAPPDGVRALSTPAGVAWVRTVPGDAPVDADEARRVLLDALGTGRTPAPARPGTRFESDAELVAALTRTAETWRATLERVRDAVEMLVFLPVSEPRRTQRDTEENNLNDELVSSVSSVSSVVNTGRAYLERLRARHAADPAARWRDELRRALGDCVREDAVVVHPSGRVLVSHLVPRDALHAYRERLDVWRRGAGAPRVVVVGPWPPFSFASHE